MKKLAACIACLSLGYGPAAAQTEFTDLSGTWEVVLDRNDRGISETWYSSGFPETRTVRLPGSLNTNGIGDPVTVETPWVGSINSRAWYEDESYARYRTPENTKVVFWLSPDKYYSGPAWYRRTFVIPDAWKGKQISLVLERCHWTTSAWVDGKPAGTRNSLGTPHRYDLTGLEPGTHELCLRVDNKIRDIVPGPDAHSVSDHTQSNWNGIVGKIGLEVRPLLRIANVKITPDVSGKKITAAMEIENRTGEEVSGTLTLQASGGPERLAEKTINYRLDTGIRILEMEYPMGEKPALWDEFAPNLYTLQAVSNSKFGSDTVTETFGMRKLEKRGTQITVNGRPVFLRGTLECCIFPETGYPPTNEQAWERIMKICRAHGLNHIRFHSWCPPEAAFNAADRLGFYLHVECGGWTTLNLGDGTPIDRFIWDESERIVREYGNHPSFCFLLYGNEPGGKNYIPYLTDFVQTWKARDNRFLYSAAAGWPAIPESDWLCLPYPRIQGWGEGINSIINSADPGSGYDWTSRISQTQPTVSHEIGQWCVYPDLKERSRYTGAFKAKNFDIFEDRLRENGLLPLAEQFLMASGKLQTLCYKADIEAALRTRGFGGFQLLDLHDFPGQGTALVGVLNPFWESKGYVTPEEYSRFCNAVVPLLRTERFILNSGETLNATVEIAQYSAEDLQRAETRWRLKDQQGKAVDEGRFTSERIPTGTLTEVGKISRLMETDVPVQYKLEVSVGEYSNDWDIWVYPRTREPEGEVRIATKLDETTEKWLRDGGKVLLTPRFGSLKNEGKDSVAVGFSTVFWNTLWTRGQAPHTLGILCDPKHPALSLFPTEYHSNYQWQDAMSHCNAIPLKKLGDGIEPVVRIIDDWFTARPLGMIVELKIGKGKLLLCSADLTTDAENRPEARQLTNSLLRYMNGDSFDPRQSSTAEAVKSLFRQ